MSRGASEARSRRPATRHGAEVGGRRPRACLGRPGRLAARRCSTGSAASTRWASTSASTASRSAPSRRRPRSGRSSLAIRMMDLTTLEGKDTPGKVRACAPRPSGPDPGDPSIPSVAAVCVYPALVPVAKAALAGTGIKVASVATGFPSGQTFTDIKLAETRLAVEAGADEIDMVIDRGAFLSGDYATVFDEIVAVKAASGAGTSQGHPRDRRAGDARQRPAREHPGHGRGRRLHQDLHGQGHPRRDAPGDARDAGGDPRLPSADGPHRGHEAGRRHPDRQGGHQLPGRAVRDARAPLDDARTCSGSAPAASSTTSSSSSRRSGPDATPDPTTSPSTEASASARSACAYRRTGCHDTLFSPIHSKSRPWGYRVDHLRSLPRRGTDRYDRGLVAKTSRRRPSGDQSSLLSIQGRRDADLR